MGLMKVTNLSVSNRLHDVNLELFSGEILGLIGPNGAGKSTLLNALAGLLEKTGEIQLNDKNMNDYSARQKAQKIALQPQFVESAWALTVCDVVSLGRLPWGDSDQKIIQQAMQMARVTELAHRHVDELSGGEKARVWLARVLANQAEVLLVDEPVANLDIHYQREVMNLLRDYARSGQAVIIAIHDLSLAAKYCDRLCLLNDKNWIMTGEVKEVLTEKLISEIYQVALHLDLETDPPVVLAK